jgi:hypothetical protein
MTTPQTKILLKLTGTDANGFALLGTAIRAGKKAGWTVEQVETFKRDAAKADFDQLLRTLHQHFDIE